MSTVIKVGAGLGAMGGVALALIALMLGARGQMYLEDHVWQCGLGAAFGVMPDDCRTAILARDYGPIAAGLGAVVTIVSLGVLVVAYLVPDPTRRPDP